MAGDGNSATEVVTVELPAPPGWKKTFTPKGGRTPKRNVIVFIAPTGEEINNKKQLDQYLRSHPGGPPSSDFDWGTGDTPRRSARIIERAKAAAIAEEEPPKRKGKRTATKMENKRKNAREDGDDETLAFEELPKKKGKRTPTKKENKQKKAIDDGDDETRAGGKETADLEMKDVGEDSAKPNVVEKPEGNTHDEEIEEDSTKQDVVVENPQDSDNAEVEGNFEVLVKKQQDTTHNVAETEEDSAKQELETEKPVENIDNMEVQEGSTKPDEVEKPLPNIHDKEVEEVPKITEDVDDNTEEDNKGSANGNAEASIETLEVQLEGNITETVTMETKNNEDSDPQIIKAEDRLPGREAEDYQGPPGNNNLIYPRKEAATTPSNCDDDDSSQKQIPEAAPVTADC